MGRVEVHVLGRCEVRLPDGRLAGPWERPVARRLVGLVALQPGHHVQREHVQDRFFPSLATGRAANALSKTLTMVRHAAAPSRLVEADRTTIWLSPGVIVDLEDLRTRLDQALRLEPGHRRDQLLVNALENHEVLLEDELYADWTREERDHLDALRASARRALARDRAAGFGRADPPSIAAAWRDVLSYEPADEEACLQLMHIERLQGHPARAARIFQSTVASLADLGLSPSAQLAAVAPGSTNPAGPSVEPPSPVAPTADSVRATMVAAARARRITDRAARTLFTEALEQIGRLSPADQARLRAVWFDAHVQLSELCRDVDDLGDADHHLRVALDLAATDAERARAWSAWGSVPYRLGDMTLAIERYERGLASLRGDDPPAGLRLTIDIAFALGRTGQADEALAMLESRCARLEEIDDPALVGRALDHLAVCQQGAARYSDALATMQLAYAVVGVLGDAGALLPLHVHRAAILGDLGRFGEGLADTAAAIRIAESVDDAYAISVAHWVAAGLREGLGDLEGALAERDAELLLLQRTGNRRNAAGAHAARARLLTVLGRDREARHAASDARATAAACGDERLMAAIESELQQPTS